jgi:hypothetical protein
MRSKKRDWDAEKMAGLVGVVHQEGIKTAPQRLLAHMAPPAEEEQPEMAEGHCLGCKQKRQFQVENTRTMKNGVLQKSGKCTGPSCTRTISTFIKGAQDAA